MQKPADENWYYRETYSEIMFSVPVQTAYANWTNISRKRIYEKENQTGGQNMVLVIRALPLREDLKFRETDIHWWEISIKCTYSPEMYVKTTE